MMEILNLIGNTPIIRLKNLEKHLNLLCPLYLKMESRNLTGSSKDRVIYYILKKAEQNRLIKKGDYVVIATSGNAGISLSVIGKKLGYKPVIVMPNGFSKEREILIKSYNAKLIKINGGMDSAINIAKSFCQQKGGYYINQFENQWAVEAHYKTGKEIFKSVKINYFFASIGTGATIMGVSKYLKRAGNVFSFGVEPFESPLLSKGKFCPHNLQGMGANIVPKILDMRYIDGILTSSYMDAKKVAKVIFGLEGISVGISTGACLHSAIRYLKSNKITKPSLVLSCDDGQKYISSGFLNFDENGR